MTRQLVTIQIVSFQLQDANRLFGPMSCSFAVLQRSFQATNTETMLDSAWYSGLWKITCICFVGAYCATHREDIACCTDMLVVALYIAS